MFVSSSPQLWTSRCIVYLCFATSHRKSPFKFTGPFLLSGPFSFEVSKSEAAQANGISIPQQFHMEPQKGVSQSKNEWSLHSCGVHVNLQGRAVVKWPTGSSVWRGLRRAASALVPSHFVSWWDLPAAYLQTKKSQIKANKQTNNTRRNMVQEALWCVGKSQEHRPIASGGGLHGRHAEQVCEEEFGIIQHQGFQVVGQCGQLLYSSALFSVRRTPSNT